jgi:glycosyltransferase involved in cell wall biosynthesis
MKPWTIAVNGAFVQKEVTGVQRAAHELLAALEAAGDPRFRFLTLTPAPRRSDWQPERTPAGEVAIDRSRLPGALWMQVRLPGLARRAGAALLWSPANAGPVHAEAHVVTIQDAAVFAGPQWFSRGFRLYYRALLPMLGRRAKVVLTSSEFSRAELIRHRVAPAERIEVIPCGVGAAFRQDAPAGRWAERRPFVLALGRRDPRKNIGAILRAWSLLPTGVRSGVRLLLAGSGEGPFASTGRDPLPGGVEAIGRVHEDELPGLYRAAEAFVYVSLYEGFGLPPLEAMACGTPVLASRVASIPEVCGDAAAYVDPLDPSDIAAGLEAVLTDAGLRSRLRAAGMARAAAFRWDTAARRTLEVFARTISAGTRREAAGRSQGASS